MRIAIVINASWNIYNFRLSLIKALLAEGHEVVAIASEDAYSQYLSDASCRFVPLAMDNSTNPFKDMALTWRLYKTYQQVKPDVVLHYTIKPNIYGSVAAYLAGIPAINNVSGLGTVFIKKDYISSIATVLYKFAFRFPVKVFFQNEDDRQLFLQNGLVKKKITGLLPGSGVDLERFKPSGAFKRNTSFTFLMVARILYDKGVVEFVEASRLIKQQHPEVKCQLLGMIDEDSRSGIAKQNLEMWVKSGAIDYLGSTDAVADVIARADCVVLPSYREGTPRSLLEAAAMGKPLIATDAPGCREVVQDGVNGYLCLIQSAQDLASKMIQMMQQHEEQLKRMGFNSRLIAEQKFNDNFVIQKYLQAIAAVTVK